MEILTEEELRDRMTECYDEMCLYSEKGDYKKAFEILYEMWELLPGNKIDHEESFSVVELLKMRLIAVTKKLCGNGSVKWII